MYAKFVCIIYMYMYYNATVTAIMVIFFSDVGHEVMVKIIMASLKERLVTSNLQIC